MKWWEKVEAIRDPDFYIGGKENPYCKRWWIIPRNRWFNIYLHKFLRSDEDRALHDHPWINFSYLLAGRYFEWTIKAGGVRKRVEYKKGDWQFRTASKAHRLEIIPGEHSWSLFITGPIMRVWGFHCENSVGWRPWTEFVHYKDPGGIGKGCDP